MSGSLKGTTANRRQFLDLRDYQSSLDPSKKWSVYQAHGTNKNSNTDDKATDLEHIDKEMINQLIAEVPDVEKMDANGAKRLLLNFENAYTENTTLRAKFSNDPSRFVQSEVDLDYHIKQLQAIATAPELYLELLKTRSLESLLSLLTHENPDIVIDSIDVLKDFLTAGEMYSQEDRLAVSKLAQELIKLQCPSLVTGAIWKLDESIHEEKQGVYDTLELVENLLEIQMDEACAELSHKTNFVQWLVERISTQKYGVFDEVKLYSSEILCILSQNSLEAQAQIGRVNGIDVLLNVLAKYRKSDPESTEEEEMIENIFNTLCLSSVYADNRDLFVQAEGLQLMKILIDAKKFCRSGALKLLSFYLTNSVDAVIKWMDVGGVGTIFTVLTKIGVKSKLTQQSEEHLISCLANMFSSLQSEQQHKAYLVRLVMKFKEKNFEKLERLVELHKKYADKMNAMDMRIAQEDDGDKYRDEEDEEKIREDRLEAGLFTLHLIDYLLALISQEDSQIRLIASKLLTNQGNSWEQIKVNLIEYASTVESEHKALLEVLAKQTFI